MPDLRPFRGLRYSPQAGDPSDLTAPPYDVIDPPHHVELCRRGPHNIVRLILGERPSPTGQPPDDWYGTAAATLKAWREQGILALDDQPAFYLYTQAFEHKGRPRRRKLLLGALRLEPYEAARVLPHENTMPGPKADRLRLIQACRANLSPILGFFPDRDGSVDQIVQTLSRAAPVSAFTDEHGIAHELRLIEDHADLATLSQALAPLPLYIADGHHRYETALTYRRLQRAAAGDPNAELPCDFILAACMSSADPGLTIRATHRIARWKDGPRPETVLEEAGRWFDVTRLSATGPDRALAALDAPRGGPAFVVYAGAAAGYALVELRDDGALRHAPYRPGSPVRRLPAAVFTHGFLEPLVGRPPKVSLDYAADAHEAVRQVDEAEPALAGLLPSVRHSEVMAIVDAGERLPPKSTFFWPKPLTGIVLRPLGED